MTKKDRIIVAVVVAALLLAAAWRLWYSISIPPSFEPGSIVSEKVISRKGDESFFKILEIPDSIFTLMQGRSYKDDCTLPRSELRYLLLLHRDLDGKAIVGEMVVNRQIAQNVRDIFLELFRQSYPIEKIRLIDRYQADDEASMLDNNTSCFNWRTKTLSDKPSKHASGMAIDINPLYNPYCLINGDRVTVQPTAGRHYLDRSLTFPYKIVQGDICHTLFTSHGFIWGGSWTSPKDYQHFQK